MRIGIQVLFHITASFAVFARSQNLSKTRKNASHPSPDIKSKERKSFAWFQHCELDESWDFATWGRFIPLSAKSFFHLSFALRPWSVPLPLLKSLVNVVSIEGEGDSDSQHRRKKGGISSCLTFAQKIKIIYERDWDKRTWLTQKRERRDVEEKIERE